jgi:hypothetical protein
MTVQSLKLEWRRTRAIKDQIRSFKSEIISYTQDQIRSFKSEIISYTQLLTAPPCDVYDEDMFT